MNNIVIKALNLQHGKDIIKFFTEHGVDTKGYEGKSNVEDALYGEDGPVYYGIIDGGRFFNHKRKHIPSYVNITTIEELTKLEIENKKNTNLQVINFLKELKHSDALIPKIFLNGSCFRLYKILKTIWPEAEAHYSEAEGGHWITKIKDNYYDINGIINPKYVKDKSYSQFGEEVEQSAYVHTHSNNLTTIYTKYIQSI